jgi:hypothetical protein
VSNLFSLAGNAFDLAQRIHRSYANGLVQIEEAVDGWRSMVLWHGLALGHVS